MVSKNLADFIIAVTGNRIKRELGGVGIYSVHLLWGFKGERL